MLLRTADRLRRRQFLDTSYTLPRPPQEDAAPHRGQVTLTLTLTLRCCSAPRTGCAGPTRAGRCTRQGSTGPRAARQRPHSRRGVKRPHHVAPPHGRLRSLPPLAECDAARACSPGEQPPLRGGVRPPRGRAGSPARRRVVPMGRQRPRLGGGPAAPGRRAPRSRPVAPARRRCPAALALTNPLVAVCEPRGAVL